MKPKQRGHPTDRSPVPRRNPILKARPISVAFPLCRRISTDGHHAGAYGRFPFPNPFISMAPYPDAGASSCPANQSKDIAKPPPLYPAPCFIAEVPSAFSTFSRAPVIFSCFRHIAFICPQRSAPCRFPGKRPFTSSASTIAAQVRAMLPQRYIAGGRLTSSLYFPFIISFPGIGYNTKVVPVYALKYVE